MKKSILFISLVAFLAFSCKKEKTTWDSNWSAPLVHGTLTLDDLLPPEYLTTNSDNYLSVVYNESVFSFNLDTLVDLPDTSIVEHTALSVGITVNPGFVWGGPADQSYNVGDIELKQVIAKQGTVIFDFKSEWQGNTIMTMDFPKISLNGVPFNQSYALPPGTQANPSSATDIIDMAGYFMDLTGTDGLNYNTLSGDFVVESNEVSASFPVATTDSLEYKVTFQDVEIDYAKGYFGSHIFSDTIGIGLPFMNNVLAGSIDIDSIKLNLSVWNGFNLVSQAKVSLLRGINSNQGSNVDLSFPQLGNYLNINPASGGLYDWDYSKYPIPIDNTNSNVTTFLENLSDSILIGYELLVNPNGNASGGSDEIFPGSSIELMLDAEFPLDFGANDLTLTDTFDISYTGDEVYSGNSASITLNYDNGFPLSANATLYLLDGTSTLIDSISGDTGIMNGTYNTLSYLTESTSGQVNFSLSDIDIANIEAAEKIALIVSFTSDSGQKVKIDANAFFDFSVKSNLDIRLHL